MLKAEQVTQKFRDSLATAANLTDWSEALIEGINVFLPDGYAAVFHDTASYSRMLAGTPPEKDWTKTQYTFRVGGNQGVPRSVLRLVLSRPAAPEFDLFLRELAQEELSLLPPPDPPAAAVLPSAGPVEFRVELGLFVAGRSTQAILADIRLFAGTRLPVLITGPTGTGKERLAQAIHQASDRSTKPYTTLNCGAIPAELLAAELFGYCRGAFTGAVGDKKGIFEATDGGTLLLDEIGEMPLKDQVALLRVLQEGAVRRLGSAVEKKIDVRVIAATNKDLQEEVDNGRFRADLYYRLKGLHIMVPPLSERPDELDAFIDFKLRELSNSGVLHTIDPPAREYLKAQPWRGNVRELMVVLETAAVRAKNGQLDLIALGVKPMPTQLRSASPTTVEPWIEMLMEGRSYAEVVLMFERRLVQHILDNPAQSIRGTSQKFGISVNTLRRRMQALGMTLPTAADWSAAEHAAA